MNNQQEQQNPRPQQQQGGGFSIYKVLIIFFLFMLISNFFKKPNLKDPNVMQNILMPGDKYNFFVEVMKGSQTIFRWNQTQMTYNLDSDNVKKINFTLNYSMLNSEPYPVVFGRVVPLSQKNSQHIYGQGDLVQFRKKKKEEQKNLLFGENNQTQNQDKKTSQMEQNKEKNIERNKHRYKKTISEEEVQIQEELQEIDRQYYENNQYAKKKMDAQKKELVPHLRNKIFMQLIYDTNVYYINQIPAQLQEYNFDVEKKLYYPLLDISQFWVRERNLIPLDNQTLLQNSTFEIELNFYNYQYFKYISCNALKDQLNMYSFGIDTDDSQLEQIKEMLEDNNPYFLGITFVVSILHSIFEFLAVKNDIQFWKNIQSHKGISLRTLYFNFFTDVIIFLYLIDSNETSWLILATSGVELVLTVWKIFKTSNFKFVKSFPFLKPQLQDEYVSTTQEFDRKANKWLYYALLPLFLGYSVYSLIYETYKGWYSFFLQTCVGFIYIFGFIQMTPQLYINYKLKSVDHLPWRTMIYKFLNTIIDDLFAFVISMPWLRRLSCFRDDVIFVIYLYQRFIYRVDKRRTQTGFVQDEVVPHDNNNGQNSSTTKKKEEEKKEEEKKEEEKKEEDKKEEQSENKSSKEQKKKVD